MGSSQHNTGSTGEGATAQALKEVQARIEDIYAAVARIEDVINGPAGGKAASGADTAALSALAGTLERLSVILSEIRNLQDRTVSAVTAAREEIAKLAASRFGSFADMLGTAGLR